MSGCCAEISPVQFCLEQKFNARRRDQTGPESKQELLEGLRPQTWTSNQTQGTRAPGRALKQEKDIVRGALGGTTARVLVGRTQTVVTIIITEARLLQVQLADGSRSQPTRLWSTAQVPGEAGPSGSQPSERQPSLVCVSLICPSKEPNHLEKLRHAQGLIPPSRASVLCCYKPKRLTGVGVVVCELPGGSKWCLAEPLSSMMPRTGLAMETLGEKIRDGLNGELTERQSIGAAGAPAHGQDAEPGAHPQCSG